MPYCGPCDHHGLHKNSTTLPWEYFPHIYPVQKGEGMGGDKTMLRSFHFSLNGAMLPFREMQKHLTSWHKYLSPCWDYMLFLLLLVCFQFLSGIDVGFSQMHFLHLLWCSHEFSFFPISYLLLFGGRCSEFYWLTDIQILNLPSITRVNPTWSWGIIFFCTLLDFACWKFVRILTSMFMRNTHL